MYSGPSLIQIPLIQTLTNPNTQVYLWLFWGALNRNAAILHSRCIQFNNSKLSLIWMSSGPKLFGLVRVHCHWTRQRVRLKVVFPVSCVGVVLQACVAGSVAVDGVPPEHGADIRSGHPRQDVGGVSQTQPHSHSHRLPIHAATGELHECKWVSKSQLCLLHTKSFLQAVTMWSIWSHDHFGSYKKPVRLLSGPFLLFHFDEPAVLTFLPPLA